MQEDDTILLESDLIFEDSMLSMVIQDANPNVALVAKYETWMDGSHCYSYNTLYENYNSFFSGAFAITRITPSTISSM